MNLPDELIIDIVDYIENKEIAIDAVFGNHRDLSQLLIDDAMPELYWRIKRIFK